MLIVIVSVVCVAWCYLVFISVMLCYLLFISVCLCYSVISIVYWTMFSVHQFSLWYFRVSSVLLVFIIDFFVVVCVS